MAEKQSVLLRIEARALITAIMLIGSFIILPIFAIYAPGFFQQIYILIFSQLGWITGYYFGAKNHEKREEKVWDYMLNILPAMPLKLPQAAAEIEKVKPKKVI